MGYTLKPSKFFLEQSSYLGLDLIDERKEKRVIYLVDRPDVKILCILDRDSEYKDLRSFLKRHRYL